jgi:hypothetical protein
MDGQELVPQDRRRFLSTLGKTLAVGVGFGLAAAPRAFGRADVCGIWCSYVSTNCDCNGTHCDNNCFHCVSTQCGYDYWECSTQSGSYCACQGCC